MEQAIKNQQFLNEAFVVAQRMGVWVIYSIRDAENIEHLEGYFLYRIEDLKRRQMRAKTSGDTERARYLADRASYWGRACRLIHRLRNREHKSVATWILSTIDSRPDLKVLPYVARTEVEINGLVQEERGGKLHECARRRSGRPRKRPARPVEIDFCKSCGGIVIE